MCVSIYPAEPIIPVESPLDCSSYLNCERNWIISREDEETMNVGENVSNLFLIYLALVRLAGNVTRMQVQKSIPTK